MDPPGSAALLFVDAMDKVRGVSGKWQSDASEALCGLAEVLRRLCREEKIKVASAARAIREPPSGGIPESLSRLAALLDLDGFLDSAHGCYRIAYAYAANTSEAGVLPGPLPGFWPGRDGMAVGPDRWKREARQIMDGIKRELEDDFGSGHESVLEAERIGGLILDGDGGFGDPEPEILSGLIRELRSHLGHQLNVADRLLSIGDNGKARDIFLKALSSVPLDPDALSKIELRALEGQGRVNFADGNADMALDCFQRAIERAGKDNFSGGVSDVMAAEVGLALALCALDRRDEAVKRLSGIVNKIEERMGFSGELTLKARTIIACSLPGLPG
jgi:tetratricopeptide (TPR) repeat protein